MALSCFLRMAVAHVPCLRKRILPLRSDLRSALVHMHVCDARTCGLAMRSAHGPCACFKLFVQTHLTFETCGAPWCNTSCAAPTLSAHSPCAYSRPLVQTHLALETCSAPWCKRRPAVPIPGLDFLFRTFCPNLTPPVVDKKLGNKSGKRMRVMSCRPLALGLPLHSGHCCLNLLLVNLLCLLRETEMNKMRT